MDDLTLRAFDYDRKRAERRLTAAVADIRVQLERIEDAVTSGKPLAGSRTRQLVGLAGDAAIAAGTLDALVEWGDVFATPVTESGK